MLPAPQRSKQDTAHPLLRPAASGNRTLTALEADVALQVCEQIALGATLAETCSKEHAGKFPALITFLRWMLLHPWVKQAYDAALELRAYSFEDEALAAAREARNAHKDKVPGVRTLLEQLRWSAERGNPKQFAPRGVTNTVVPIQITTSLNLGQPGAEDAVSPDNIWKVEARVAREEATTVAPVEAPNMVPGRDPRKRQLTPHVLEDGSPNPAHVAERKATFTAAQQARRARERGETDVEEV